MSSNQQTEIKLLEMFDKELAEFVAAGSIKPAMREGKDSFFKCLQDFQRKIDIYKKQVFNFKTLFPSCQEYNRYEARALFFQGCLEIFASAYYDLYSSLFSPTKKQKLTEALNLFEKSLETNESAKTRELIVFCHRLLGDKKRALQELDNILQKYADDEEVYLDARKQKAELEE